MNHTIDNLEGRRSSRRDKARAPISQKAAEVSPKR